MKSVTITEDGVFKLGRLAELAPSGLRVVPEILWRLSESENYVIDTGWSDVIGCVGRTSWYKGVNMLRMVGLIVKRKKGVYVINARYIKKSPPTVDED